MQILEVKNIINVGMTFRRNGRCKRRFQSAKLGGYKKDKKGRGTAPP